MMSNQEAIEILKIERNHMIPTLLPERIEAMDMAISALQLEIIRCKDCKYCDRGIDEDGNPFLKCLGWVYGGTQEEDFCSHAERMASDDHNLFNDGDLAVQEMGEKEGGHR